jgi:hypothetical protein
MCLGGWLLPQAWAQVPNKANVMLGGLSPTSILLDVTAANATDLLVSMQTSGGTYVAVDPATYVVVVKGNNSYVLIDSLLEGTAYGFIVAGTNASGTGDSDTLDLTTLVKGKMIHHHFEAENAGFVRDSVTNRDDSLLNATIVPSGLSGLGNALHIEPIELVPGIFDNSSVYLDNSFNEYVTEVLGSPPISTNRFVEGSYSIWFKIKDTANFTDGAVITSFGSTQAHGLAVYNDSLFLCESIRYAGVGNFFGIAGIPFRDTSWNHVVWRFNAGRSQVVLNGELVIDIDNSADYLFQVYATRFNDLWASNQLGVTYWFHRGFNPVLPDNFGDQTYHHNMTGDIADLQVYNYALDDAEVADLLEVASTPIPAIYALSPSSIVLRLATTDSFPLNTSVTESATGTVVSVTTNTIVKGNFTSLYVAGLTPGADYDVAVSQIKPDGETVPVVVSATTPMQIQMVHHKFEAETNGFVVDEVTGKGDSLLNATIVPSGNNLLGNAVRIAPSEVVPGVFDPSSVYLDSSLSVYINTVGGSPPISSTLFAEGTYAVWFQITDTANFTNGAIITSFGSTNSHGLAVYNDSLWLCEVIRFDGSGPGRDVFVSGGIPFRNTDWNHAVWRFDGGRSQVFLNGQLVINIDNTAGYNWQNYAVRYADYWASNQLGVTYWWSRGFDPVLPDNFGDQTYHHQMTGHIGDLQLFNYPLSPAEISDLYAEVGAPAVSLEALSPSSLVLDIAQVGVTFDVQASANGGAFTPVAAANLNAIEKGSITYLYLNGLTEGTDYEFSVAVQGTNGSTLPATVGVSTPMEMKIIHHEFEAEQNGFVTDNVTGKSDSLLNASIVPAGFGTLGNALKVAPLELVPGIFENSTVYMDSSFSPYFFEVSGSPSIHWNRFAEGTYAVWFKINDTANFTNGAVITSFGSTQSHGLAVYNDSLWLAEAIRFAGVGNVLTNGGVPFTDTTWTHAVWRFEAGVSELYLNGSLVLTLDHAADFQYQAYAVRYSDYWASNQLGTTYWYSRGFDPVLPDNFGDQVYHHQMDGFFGDLQIYNYALTPEGITDLYTSGTTGIVNQPVKPLSVFPNPAHDQLFFSEVMTGEARVYDLTGRMIQRETMVANNRMDVSGLTPGVYLLKLIDQRSDQVRVARFIIE